jgi:hypothetical protein
MTWEQLVEKVKTTECVDIEGIVGGDGSFDPCEIHIFESFLIFMSSRIVYCGYTNKIIRSNISYDQMYQIITALTETKE